MNYFKHLSLLCFMLLAMLFSCKENIDTSNRYVFRERTIASYLTSHEQFSDYVKLLKAQKISDLSETSVYQLMTAYGAYTCSHQRGSAALSGLARHQGDHPHSLMGLLPQHTRARLCQKGGGDEQYPGRYQDR